MLNGSEKSKLAAETSGDPIDSILRFASKAVSSDQRETAASVTIVTLGRRVRCAKAGCWNLARLNLHYADAGGRPFCIVVFCHAHAQVKLTRDRAAGLKVYDDRDRT